jgi:CBS-domain-containing membrane protein
MMRRRRRHAPPGEYSDPLSNYDPPEYEDDLERSLCEQPITGLQTAPFDTISPQTAMADAVRQMVELDIACLMVAEGDRLVGVLSERDVLTKAAEDWERFKQLPVAEVMTPDPVSVYETDSPAKALNIMAVGSFRHVPILDVDERVVGIVGPRRVTRFLRGYFE